MRKLSSKGFGTVEIIIVVAAIAAVGAAGLLVNSRNNSTKKAADTKQAQQSSPTPAPTAAPAPASTPTAKPAEKSYLVLTEWGVRITLTDDIKDLQYYMKNNQYAYFSTKKLTALKPSECTTASGPLGALGRYVAGDDYYGDPIENNSAAIKIGKYYYAFGSPQASCSNDDDVNNVQSDQLKLVKVAAKTVEAVQ